MKKIISLALIVMMIATMACISISAEDATTADIYVTIADGEGKLVVKYEAFTISDVDNDGALTINDAFIVVHKAYDKEYATSASSYGAMVTKLWGVENGGSYGYYVNNASAWSLADPVKDGDHLYAFIYQDLTAWSDAYSFFDVKTVSLDANQTLTLTLNKLVYDMATYTYNTVPATNATITIDGEKTEVKTNENGVANVKVPAGTHTISAVSDVDTLVPAVCVATVATSDTASVYVTVADGTGKLPMSLEKVTVSDADKDGALTINDALYCAHDKSFDGGAAAGYASYLSQYGLSLSKLWGIENGGSYGYYVNNASAWSLADPVKDGDIVSAFVYSDLTTWSDKYCYFDNTFVTVDGKDTVTVTLKYAGYDENYAPVQVPVASAVIYINGEATTYVTDENGTVQITVPSSGEYSISAKSESINLVPPVAVIEFTNVPTAIEDTTSAGATAEETTASAIDSTSAPEPAKKGCFSMAGSAIVVTAIVSVMGVAIVKKNH